MTQTDATITRILVPTDFSSASEQALRQAAVLSRAHDAPIHVLHILALHGDDRAEAEASLPDCVPEDVAPHVEARTIERAITAETGIVHASREGDLIVMGTHGRSGLKHVVLGSTAERVVQYAAVPVVTVRPADLGGHIRPVNTILCPVDFSEPGHVALDMAEDLARRLDAALVIAHVVEPVLYPVAYGVPAGSPLINIEEQAKKGALEALHPMVEDISSRGVDAKALVVCGTASIRISELAEEQGIDMVVMATHGLTGIAHLLLGSTAERVVRHCPVPVMTVKTTPAAKTEPSKSAESASV